MSARAVTTCFTRASLAPECDPGSLSRYLGFDSLLGLRHKEGIRVEGEHHGQGATGVLFPRHLERPQYALGPHEQRRGGGRAAIHFDTNSDHPGPPSVCKAFQAPLTLLGYRAVTAAQKVGNNRYDPGAGPDRMRRRGESPSFQDAL